MPSLDDLGLDLPGWQLEERDHTQALWSSPDGDGLLACYFGLAPDIGEPLDDLDALRGFYGAVVDGSGGRLVELEVVTVAGVASVRMVIELAHPERGTHYLGSLTLPFDQFSFVIKVQCDPRGASDQPLPRCRRALDAAARGVSLSPAVTVAPRFIGP